MILPDANLLIYAYSPRSPQHEASRLWLETVLSGIETVLLTWPTVWAFLRITSNPNVFERPLSIQEAINVVTSWIARPNVAVVGVGNRHWEILRTLLEDGQCQGPLVSDAVLAAIAVEHGGVVHTTDRDFARFGQLELRNPLQ